MELERMREMHEYEMRMKEDYVKGLEGEVKGKTQ